MQALASYGLVEYTSASLSEMEEKHPAPRRPQLPPPVTVMPSMKFSPADVATAALSFQKGSAAGPSGMRPEHFKSILKNTSAALANKALGALTRAVNAMAAGKVPAQVRPYFVVLDWWLGRKRTTACFPLPSGIFFEGWLPSALALPLLNRLKLSWPCLG